MKKASEYAHHAEECRHLAATIDGVQRAQLLEMAATWEKLAAERTALVRQHPELEQPATPHEIRSFRRD